MTTAIQPSSHIAIHQPHGRQVYLQTIMRFVIPSPDGTRHPSPGRHHPFPAIAGTRPGQSDIRPHQPPSPGRLITEGGIHSHPVVCKVSGRKPSQHTTRQTKFLPQRNHSRTYIFAEISHIRINRQHDLPRQHRPFPKVHPDSRRKIDRYPI